MDNLKVDVIIPTYRPGKELTLLLERLKKQDYPIDRLIIMNTEENLWKKEWELHYPSMEVYHLSKKEFDHGGTRRRAAELSTADVLIYMTQDAVPADGKLIRNLIRPLLENPKIGAAYARQLPREDCRLTEKYTRYFNYPPESQTKTLRDLPKYGIKTYFCSDVCAAYRRNIYEKLGGFEKKTIFNEDMLYAAKLIHSGYSVAYAADARVIHSHNYTCSQQFHRNFDMGVSQAEHPEIFRNVPSEGEGLRLVKNTIRYLAKKRRILLIPGFVLQCGCRYAGYFLGKRYKKLPRKMVFACTSNRNYWM